MTQENRSGGRCTLLVFNTVERLLRGDFFHAWDMEDVTVSLSRFPGPWIVVGLGTSNWYRRNGELVVGGDCERPRYLWGDPESEPLPGRLFDLAGGLREALTRDLVTPEVGRDDTRPRFPFVCAAACAPDDGLAIEVPDGESIHARMKEEMARRNIGFAAIRAEVRLSRAVYTTCCHIPLGGFRETEGEVYSAFRQADLSDEVWDLRGLYALNPTVQRMISVEGHALHLHGHAAGREIAGHLVEALPAAACRLQVWPVRDLKLTIRDLDVAWMPVRREVLEP